MTRPARARTVLLLALPGAAAAIGLTLWAGPYWAEEVRQHLAERRWPEQRTQVETALAAVRLPDRYAVTPCPSTADVHASSCWRIEGAVDDAVATDLSAALGAAGVADVTTSSAAFPPDGAISVTALGTVAGRVVMLDATRETDIDRLPETPFADTSLVSLVGDLTPP